MRWRIGVLGGIALILAGIAMVWATQTANPPQPASDALIMIWDSEYNDNLPQAMIVEYEYLFPNNEPILPTRGLRRLAARWYLQPGMDFEFATILLGGPDWMYGGYWLNWDWLEDGISICEDDQGIIQYITITEDTD